MGEAIMWFATGLNLTACALNLWSYIDNKRLNKELEEIVRQPVIKVVDMRPKAEQKYEEKPE